MREDHRYDVRAACISLAVCLLPLAAAGADPPPEVEGVLIDPTSTLSWDPVSAADVYHVYRGLGSEFLRGAPPRCHGTRLTETSFASPQEPDAGEAYVYLVTAASDAEGEGTPGHETGGAERALLGGCEPVMRHHILDRIGYGWSEWHRDRLSALGWQGYVDEQLAPETIDESGNTLLSARLNRWSDPETFQELVYLRQDRSLYTWRQLEQQTTEFWQNHFTTYYLKTYEYLLGPYLGNSEHAQRGDQRCPQARRGLVPRAGFRWDLPRHCRGEHAQRRDDDLPRQRRERGRYPQ